MQKNKFRTNDNAKIRVRPSLREVRDTGWCELEQMRFCNDIL